MNILIFGIYGFLLGALMADCKKRFGNEVFWIILGVLITLSTGAWIKYHNIL